MEFKKFQINVSSQKSLFEKDMTIKESESAKSNIGGSAMQNKTVTKLQNIKNIVVAAKKKHIEKVPVEFDQPSKPNRIRLKLQTNDIILGAFGMQEDQRLVFKTQQQKEMTPIDSQMHVVEEKFV